jgi:hypothetical protein
VDDEADRLRLWLTFCIAVTGIAVVFIAFLVSVLTFKDATQPGELIPAVLGTVTAAVGTLAGLIVGHGAGAAGKERAEHRADLREQEAAAGRTLAESLKADDATLASLGGETLEAAGPMDGQSGAAVIRKHADLANRLFP